MTALRYLLSVVVLFPSFLVVVTQGSSANPAQEASSQVMTTVKIVMIPSGSEKKAAEKVYQLGSKPYIKVVAKNDSDQRIRVVVVDTYYQNRPRLFKNGPLLAYRGEIKKLITSKDEYPEFVRIGSVIYLEPYSSTDLEELNLSDWYGPLQPGSYRLHNRYRFEIDGPWTADSAPLLFEVAANGS